MNSDVKSGATKESRKRRSSAKSLIHDPEREAFENLRYGLHNQIAPTTPLENDIFTKLIHASWNLRRLRELEESLFLTYDDPFTGDDAAPRMLTYHRYAARFERAYRHAIGDLRQLQTDRALSLQFTESAPVTITALTDITKLLKQFQRAHPTPSAAGRTIKDVAPPTCTNDLLYNVLTRRAGARPARLPDPPPIPDTTK